jgi:hypothetical protein
VESGDSGPVTTAANVTPRPADSESSAAPRLDSAGRYRARGRYSLGVVGFYSALTLLVVYALRSDFGSSIGWAAALIVALLVFFLVRYLSTRYWIDDTYLHAWRILGGTKVPLDRVRRIEFSSLRTLSPVGFFGSWGWRGRMWSPTVGAFNSIHTESSGLLVTADPVPIFLSPRDPPAFARELSRRVRSYTGRLAVDVGDPSGSGASAA